VSGAHVAGEYRQAELQLAGSGSITSGKMPSALPVPTPGDDAKSGTKARSKSQPNSSTTAYLNERANPSNRWQRRLGFATVIALVLTGTLTFLILFGLTPLEPNPLVVRAALATNTLLALMLIALIAMEVMRLIRSRRNGRAAARLHIRIVGLFALVAAIPAILVAIVASVTLDLGLDRWFEQRTKDIVQSSVNVAEAYVDESTRVHLNATVSMASELDRARRLYSLDRTGFTELMALQTRGRGMILSQLLKADGEPIITSKIVEDAVIPEPSSQSLEAANSGDVIFIPRGTSNLVGAVLKMRVIPDAYLYTVRPLRDDVLQSLRQMEANTNQYDEMELSRLPVQLTFAVLYLGVALMILLAAIWMGISVADRFVRPIRRLITAADEISGGNLDVAVELKHTEGDFKNLGDTFNVMTSQLRSQRSQLLKANADIDKRARFTEAVLSGVTAAVIGVDEHGSARIANSTTKSILGANIKPGEKISERFPDLGKVLDNARNSGRGEYREQITMMIDGQSRTLNAQVTQEREIDSDNSFVITIDDITDLVVAQRSTAWSDVARRIAHEIKNPLTPIQLSAERIRKRYSKYITEDREVFDQCTDTIIRQVGDIGRMVDEFSSFARMPKPEMRKGDLSRTIQEALFTQKVANPSISFEIDLGKQKNIARFDERLMSQALINIMKNAVEAIEGSQLDKQGKSDTPPEAGKVRVHTWHDEDMIVIDVIDNGKGLPQDNRQQLLEPYMTTRQKGTGLGLAIVRKILEDHGGTIELLDAPQVATGGKGALMRLRVPKYISTDADDPAPSDKENHTTETKPIAENIGAQQSQNPETENPKDKKDEAGP